MAALPEKFSVKEPRTINRFPFMQRKLAKHISMMKCHKLCATVTLHLLLWKVALSILKLAISVLKVRHPVEGMFLSLPGNVNVMYTWHDGGESPNMSQRYCYVSGNITWESRCHYSRRLGKEKACGKVDPSTYDHWTKGKVGDIDGCCWTFCKNEPSWETGNSWSDFDVLLSSRDKTIVLELQAQWLPQYKRS